MAFSCSVDGPLLKLVSPITSAPCVVSTITKLSDEIERRLTASAGYDSLVHCHCAAARAVVGAVHEAASWQDASTSCTSCRPNGSVVVNGSSKAAHFT